MKLEHRVTQGVSLVFLGLYLDDILIQEGQDAAFEVLIIIRPVLFILGPEVRLHNFSQCLSP
jgi:hypothetical protein